MLNALATNCAGFYRASTPASPAQETAWRQKCCTIDQRLFWGSCTAVTVVP
jgi:hypothetical protein